MPAIFKAYDEQGNIRLDSTSSVLMVESTKVLTNIHSNFASTNARSAFSTTAFHNSMEGSLILGPNNAPAGTRSRYKAYLPHLRDNHQITLPNVFGVTSYTGNSNIELGMLTTDSQQKGVIVSPAYVTGEKGFMNIYSDADGTLMFSAKGLLKSVRTVGSIYVPTDGVKSGQRITTYTVPSHVDMNKLYLMYSGVGEIGYSRGASFIPGGGIGGSFQDDMFVVGLAVGRRGRQIFINPVADIFVVLLNQWVPSTVSSGVFMSDVLGTEGGITITLVTTG